MWTWTNDGSIDVPEETWSTSSNQYVDMFWERLEENNIDSIAQDPELELLPDISLNSCKRLHCPETSNSSARDLATISSEMPKFSQESKIIREDSSAKINNTLTGRQPPVLVDLEAISLRTEDWGGFSLSDATVLRQNKDDANQPISQEASCDLSVLSGKAVGDFIEFVKVGKHESIPTSLNCLLLPSSLSPSSVQKKPYEEDIDDNKEYTRHYEWEQIDSIEAMENLLSKKDGSSVGEDRVNQPFSLQWPSSPSHSAPPTLLSHVMVNEFNGQQRLNKVASAGALCAGAMEKTSRSLEDQMLFHSVNSHEDHFKLPIFTSDHEFRQPNYLGTRSNAIPHEIKTTKEPQAKGLTFDDRRALEEILKGQGIQASSFSGIKKVQQTGGQPTNYMWSEDILNRKFSLKNIQQVSVAETPLQHGLSAQKFSEILSQANSIHEILPLPEAASDPRPVAMRFFPQQQAPFRQQLPLHPMPQLHNQALQSNPSSIPQEIKFQQAHAGPYQQRNQQLSCLSHSPPRSLSGTKMTPQEKIEKLRWRQQIQARVAAEEKQKQLSINDSISAGNEIFAMQQPAQAPRVGQLGQISYNQPNLAIKLEERMARASATQTDLNSSEKAKQLDAALLHQLESVIKQLDIRTRLSMRDALYRLASSAIVRHGDLSASGEHTSLMSRFAEASTLETPTNPVDRAIANLLFHEQTHSSPMGHAYPLTTADATLPTSPPASGDSKRRAIQAPRSEAHSNWNVPSHVYAIKRTGQRMNFSANF